MTYAIPSFHPLYRIGANDSIRWDLVAEVVQTAPSDPAAFPLRGGTTMIVSTHSTGGTGQGQAMFLRYIISKPLYGARGDNRRERQDEYLEQMGFRRGSAPSGLRANFALIDGQA